MGAVLKGLRACLGYICSRSFQTDLQSARSTLHCTVLDLAGYGTANIGYFVFWEGRKGEPTGRERKPEHVRGNCDRVG